MELSDRTLLITGGAHRLGGVLALALAEAGAHILIHYHHAEAEAQATARAIRALGRQAWLFRADLTNPAELDQLFAHARATVGRVDVLINSAAVMERHAVLSVTRAAWDHTLALNLTAPFFCAQRAAQWMLETTEAAEAGVIINLADVAGLKPWANYPAHSVSKAGVIMLTQVLAKALAPRIRVNAIAPGLVLKPEAWADAQWQALAQRTLLKHPGSSYDVARAAKFLIENDFITGETLVVDGGYQHT